ncbi:MAG: hypothetical protein IJX63_06500, partial [Lachnospiraceae bacterium]|nr:hypothetical protein [Lachnospiraceae bacterium]
MIIAHNMSAMNTQRQFGINKKSRAKSTEKLSSGYKINRSADDAAGLSISEKMRHQIRGLTQGVQNTQEGISLCQIADGALAEVNEMLNRITELSIKAANGTNTEEDKTYIQQEINQLLAEIDKVGDTTFNEKPIFRGYEEILQHPDGTRVVQGDIPYSDFSLADLDLGTKPFDANSGADDLQLQAIVNNVDSGANGYKYNLIYGNGSTSSSSFRLTDSNGQKTVVRMDSLTATNFNYDDATKTWSRDFNYTKNGYDLTITQKVNVEDTSSTEKNYVISYEVKNNDATNDVGFEFLYHADTAYNNNDRCEGYFVNGNRVNQFCVYSDANSSLTAGSTSSNVITTGVPSSFSIVDVDKALAFSEKISFETGQEPDSLSMGHYSRIDEWPYYESLNSELGKNAVRADLGFSLYYDKNLTASSSESFSFKYGIAATESDANIHNVTLVKDMSYATVHHDKLSLWIQSGDQATSGLDLIIDEMNGEVLGLRGLNVTTEDGSTDALNRTKYALGKLMDNRSMLGSYQNRMEHIVNGQNNVIENTTAAESRIRDTDMAKEMVQYSNENILE